MDLHTSTHPVRADMISHQHYASVDCARTEGGIIVILCALYCNVFSQVNEKLSNLTVLHSVEDMALESDFAGRVGPFACYCYPTFEIKLVNAFKNYLTLNV